MEEKIKELCKQPTHIICIYNDVHTKLIRAFVGSCHFTRSAAPSLIDGVDGWWAPFFPPQLNPHQFNCVDVKMPSHMNLKPIL